MNTIADILHRKRAKLLPKSVKISIIGTKKKLLFFIIFLIFFTLNVDASYSSYLNRKRIIKFKLNSKLFPSINKSSFFYQTSNYNHLPFNELNSFLNFKNQTPLSTSIHHQNEFNLNNLVLNDKPILENKNKFNLINSTFQDFINKSSLFQLYSNKTNNFNIKRDHKIMINQHQENILQQIDDITNSKKCVYKKFELPENEENKSFRGKYNQLLLKTIEPDVIEMPIINNSNLFNDQLKNYYRNLIEKLELVSSILYDNNIVNNTTNVQNIYLMRKVLRECANLHPHILRVRILNLDSNAYGKTDYLNNFNKRNSQSKQSTYLKFLTNQNLKPSIKLINKKQTNQRLHFRNLHIYLRDQNESIIEYKNETLPLDIKNVHWLNVKQTDAKSSTLKKFYQLLNTGKLFVLDENERIFSGWTGIYFDCVMRTWLFSYTNLLVSCKTCSSFYINKNNYQKFESKSKIQNQLEMRLIGILSVDISLDTLDINQCPFESLNNKFKHFSSNFSSLNTLKSNITLINSYQDLPFSSIFNRTSNNIFSNQSYSSFYHKMFESDYDQTSKHPISSFQTNKQSRLILHFEQTNKCHQLTSQCDFTAGHGLRKGSYSCKCKPGYYSILNKFSGIEAERIWKEKKQNSMENYEKMYTCKKCSEGCITCHDSSPCLSSYNWAFRISLLAISILCIFLTFSMIYYIYIYRKFKVFKVASPIFLILTLLGCSIMYSEMIMIFPVLNTAFCIMTKVTRHIGFCITYSALLLKTWRVSLTYRVKSAHKLKLTDRQLLQWLFPILLVIVIFLGAWMISATPKSKYILDWNNLKFRICDYNWWDHSLFIGEFLFLLWGIKVCYNVRNAESFFNEAKYITWTIYNITVVNMTMVLVHTMILPNAGPDVKYFLGFIRTQLSTTTTIFLIFGAKFYRLIKGEGDSWDIRVRARGVNASFSLDGVGVVNEELTDLYQENEELKEQVHKLATQVELMRLMQMQVSNRHLKNKHNTNSLMNSTVGVLNTGLSSNNVNNANASNLNNLTNSNANQNANPYHFNYGYMNSCTQTIENTGIGIVTSLVTPGLAISTRQSPVSTSYQRISPAAELQSEKV